MTAHLADIVRKEAFHTEAAGLEPAGCWYAVQTKGGQEALAQRNLARQDFEVFCPTFQKQVRHARKVTTRSKALFPGYLFVLMDLSRQEWFSINNTYGVLGLVAFGNRPAQLPPGFVERMRSLSGTDGALSLSAGISAGDRVRVISGAFDNWIGEVVELPDQQRVTLLIDMISRKVPMTLDRNQLTRLS